MTPSDLAIQTQSLTKNYGSVRALRGFYLLFERRDVRVSGTGGWKMPTWMTMNWWLSMGKKAGR
jgi:hypothetical protein